MEQPISRRRLEEARDSALRGIEIRKRNGSRDWFDPGIFAAMDDVDIAVTFYPDISEACEYLRSRDMVRFLNDLAAYHEASREERIPQGLPFGNDVIRYCLFACTCWLMEADQVAQRWIDLGCHPMLREWKLLRKFDIAYIEAHAALIKKTPYSLPEAKRWLSWEKHLLRYAALAAAITRGEDVAPYIQEILKYFNRRNRTYGLTENYGLLDGCKLRPASFDIRLEGILSYARRHYGLEVPETK